MRAWRAAARRLKRDTLTVYYACTDRRTPTLVRLLGAGVAAYALSPIDLIPDFIPVLGLLDDLVLVPLGVTLVVRLLPAAVLADARMKASAAADRPVSRAGAAAIVLIWILLGAIAVAAIARF